MLQVGKQTRKIVLKNLCGTKRRNDDAKVNHEKGGLIIAPNLSLEERHAAG